MDKKTVGAWLVHHTNKLDEVTDTGKYGNIRIAGKSGILLAALSTNDDSSLTNDQIKVLARSAGVDTTFELPRLLQGLAEHHLVEKKTHGVEVLGLTSETVLDHATEIFKSLPATAEEFAAIHLAEACSQEPRDAPMLEEFLSDKYRLDSRRFDTFLQDTRDIGFSDSNRLDSDAELFFNGNLFRLDEIEKAAAVLASISPSDRSKVAEADDQLRRCGCMTAEEITRILGDSLFKKLQSIAMYDVSMVSNSKEAVAYVTRPSAFSKFGSGSDAFDLAKALVAAITYGIHRSTPGRGRITMVQRLLRKLIRGEWIGPATAIGEDYRVLELRNVVEVKRHRYAYSMRLLKREVGTLALQVVTDGDASEQSLASLPGAAITNFQPPEENRMLVRRRHRSQSGSELAELLQTLRTGRHLE